MPVRFPVPAHVVLRCADAATSNLAGYAVAGSLHDQFTVLEVRGAGEAAPDGTRWEEVVPASRHLIAFGPGDGSTARRGPPGEPWPIVRADRPEETLSHLPEFLASPAAAGRGIRQRLGVHGALVALIVNGGGVARLFPDDPRITGRLMATQREFGMSIVLASDETPRKDFVVFDYAFDVLPEGPDSASTRLRCARAPAGDAIRPGDELRLGDLSGGPDALRQLRSAPRIAGPP